MFWLKKTSVVIPCLLAVSILISLSSWSVNTPGVVEKGYIKGRTKVMIRVYEENADNNKGGVLYSDWIQQDEYVSVNTERGRIIYDYRYTANDNWTTAIHVTCRGGREEAVLVP